VLLAQAARVKSRFHAKPIVVPTSRRLQPDTASPALRALPEPLRPALHDADDVAIRVEELADDEPFDRIVGRTVVARPR
jgi:hypothetical protein